MFGIEDKEKEIILNNKYYNFIAKKTNLIEKIKIFIYKINKKILNRDTIIINKNLNSILNRLTTNYTSKNKFKHKDTFLLLINNYNKTKSSKLIFQIINYYTPTLVIYYNSKSKFALDFIDNLFVEKYSN